MNTFLASYPELLTLWEWLQTQAPAIQLSVAVMAVIALFACLFVFKNLLIAVLRMFGLASPSLYRKFIVFPWRPVFTLWLRFCRFREHLFRIGKHSTGGYAGVLATLTNRYNPKTDIPLGLPWMAGLPCYQMIGHTIETHMMVIAQSGAGKSVFLKTVIAQWIQHNSLFVIDPKSEHRRDILSCKSTHTLVSLRPYDMESGQVNPFDCLREAFHEQGESAAIKYAYRIGQSFIESNPNTKQPFFTETSRGYFVGLILLVESHFPLKDRHLGTVRDLIVHGLPTTDEFGVPDNDPELAFASLYEMMMGSSAFGGAIAGAAAPFINAKNETKGSLQATIQERTKVLDIPTVRHMLNGTTRSLRDLKRCRNYALTYEASVSSIRNELQDVTRLITNMVIFSFEDEPIKNGQCLVLLDEFNASGTNSTISTYLPILRSMGASLLPAVQDLEGLKACYPSTFMSFIGNSDATIWMSSPHPMNKAELSRTLGKKTIIEKDQYSGKKSYREVDVATPEQLGRFLDSETGNMIVTRAGKRPLRLVLDPHHKALSIKQYNADPDHKEALLRRLSRFVLNLFIRCFRRDASAVQTAEPAQHNETTSSDELDQFNEPNEFNELKKTTKGEE
jgi:hypothetical protein